MQSNHPLGPIRLQREIESPPACSNLPVLSVYDSGVAGDQLWFTMPFVKDRSLQDRRPAEG